MVYNTILLCHTMGSNLALLATWEVQTLEGYREICRIEGKYVDWKVSCIQRIVLPLSDLKLGKLLPLKDSQY